MKTNRDSRIQEMDRGSPSNSDILANLYFDRARENGRAKNRIPSGEARTPRPTPLFFEAAQTFSTKKERNYTPTASLPPKPPVKSAPPVSRIFPHKLSLLAQPVSFKNSNTDILASPHYNVGKKELYFDQCFQIESRLGSGSFGEVFKVRSKEDGKCYAIKRSKDRFRGESDRKRKLAEVDKNERLPQHPNCVQFFKAWEERGHLYIQSELCQTSLSNFAEQNHDIPERLIWNYLVDLLMAVNHLHKYDLIHMDIKPENIFISDRGNCKLGDFGLVLDMRNQCHDHSEALEGDSKYLAPELMKGHFGPSADVFSVGITILELACDLDLPRGGDLWHQLRSGHLPDEFLLGVSPELRKVVSCMMVPDPHQRPTAREILSKPQLRYIWRRRKCEHMIDRIVTTMRLFGWLLWQLMVTVFMSVTYPLHNMVPLQPTRATPRKDKGHPPDWDHSFSDDDMIFGEDINIHNNSMGAPLDYSSSSEESLRDQEGFLIPSVLPVRLAQTTPGMRPLAARPFIHDSICSPALSSNGSPSFFSSSPVSSHANVSLAYRSSDSVTPNSNSYPSSIDDIEMEVQRPHTPEKTGIEPKNLLDAFVNASFEDDEEL